MISIGNWAEDVYIIIVFLPGVKCYEYSSYIVLIVSGLQRFLARSSKTIIFVSLPDLNVYHGWKGSWGER